MLASDEASKRQVGKFIPPSGITVVLIGIEGMTQLLTQLLLPSVRLTVVAGSHRRHLRQEAPGPAGAKLIVDGMEDGAQ